jgi:hypothetical protein
MESLWENYLENKKKLKKGIPKTIKIKKLKPYKPRRRSVNKKFADVVVCRGEYKEPKHKSEFYSANSARGHILTCKVCKNKQSVKNTREYRDIEKANQIA